MLSQAREPFIDPLRIAETTININSTVKYMRIFYLVANIPFYKRGGGGRHFVSNPIPS